MVIGETDSVANILKPSSQRLERVGRTFAKQRLIKVNTVIIKPL